MSLQTFSIPYAVDLTKESAWQSYPHEKYAYFMTRFHFVMLPRQAGNTTRIGGILNSYRTTPQSEIEIRDTIEHEMVSVSLDESILSEAVSHETLVQLSQQLGSQLEFPGCTLSLGVGTQVSQAMQSARTQTSKRSQTQTRRQKQTLEIKQSIHSGNSEKIFAVDCYKRQAVDVYLHYFDYLYIQYQTRMMGLRKKKRNYPRPLGNQHINRIKLNIPLFSLEYWEPLPQSCMLYTETEYAAEARVEDPGEVEYNPLDRPLSLQLPARPHRPTLYTLSNIAFPLRWVDRQGSWTIEELKQIELEEAEGSLWWFQYGPGRKHRKKHRRR